MIFRSLCSGIEAASVAWAPLGWKADAFSEIDPFPCAVLAHHYPDIPNLGDMTRFKEWPDANFDVLAGGTPCQSFSVAGLRGGLDDARGGLMLTYGEIAARYRPRWLVWENVAGVLSSAGGSDFAAFLGLLTGRRIRPPREGWGTSGSLGGIPEAYGLAWRMLDAQYFGVPQRRRRVFVVGYLGDWRPAAAVLFERHSLQGHSAPRREAGAHPAAGTLGGTSPGGGWRFGADEAAAGQLIADTLRSGGGPNSHGKLNGSDRMPMVASALGDKGGSGYMDATAETFVPVDYTNARLGGHVSNTIDAAMEKGNRGQGVMAYGFQSRIARNGRGDMGDVVNALNAESGETGKGDAAPLVAITFDPTQITSKDNRSNPKPGDPCHTLAKGAHAPAVAFHGTQDPDVSGDITHPMGRNQGQEQAAMIGAQVRRLTPRECERLQGFPDDYTLIPGQAAKKAEPDYLEYFRALFPEMSAAEIQRLAKDGPRYKALGNSWAVPCARWIGERIQLVDQLRRAAL